MLIFFILSQICYYECEFVLKSWKKSRDVPFGQNTYGTVIDHVYVSSSLGIQLIVRGTSLLEG